MVWMPHTYCRIVFRKLMLRQGGASEPRSPARWRGGLLTSVLLPSCEELGVLRAQPMPLTCAPSLEHLGRG